MPVVKFNVGSKAVDAEPDGGTFYDGEVPPKGMYNVRVKRLRLKKNKNSDWMINGIAEINEPSKSKKSKYNGYGIWFNQNVTDQGSGYVNSFLDAISGGKKAVRKAFWMKGCKTDTDKTTPNILAIGPLKIDPDGMPARLAAKEGVYNGEDKLDVATWVLPKKQDSIDDDLDEDDLDDEEDEDIEDDDDLDIEDEDDDDEDEEEDEDEEDEEDEEDDEPEPPKAKRKRKKAVDDEPPF